jgi:hypothetical protein
VVWAKLHFHIVVIYLFLGLAKLAKLLCAWLVKSYFFFSTESRNGFCCFALDIILTQLKTFLVRNFTGPGKADSFSSHSLCSLSHSLCSFCLQSSPRAKKRARLSLLNSLPFPSLPFLSHPLPSPPLPSPPLPFFSLLSSSQPKVG